MHENEKEKSRVTCVGLDAIHKLIRRVCTERERERRGERVVARTPSNYLTGPCSDESVCH